ncbi:MAG: hypothetical protein HQL53_00410 [Magnetococcales bacterium]|nr:hypothetical protein [Magnetococcales bacterium]
MNDLLELLQQRFTYLLLAIATAALMVWSVIWCVADLFTLPVQWVQQERIANKNSSPMNREIWRKSVQFMWRAHDLNPVNPDYLDKLGDLHFQQARFFPRRSNNANQFYQRAALYYQEAARLRPTWGEAWMKLAYAQLTQKAQRKMALQTLERAAVLGPLEPGIQERALKLRMNLWSLLDQHGRETLRNQVLTMINQHYALVIRVATRYKRLKIVRRWLVENRNQVHDVNKRLSEIDAQLAKGKSSSLMPPSSGRQDWIHPPVNRHHISEGLS